MLHTVWSSRDRITGDDVASLAVQYGVSGVQAGDCRLGLWWSRVDLNGLDEGLEWALFSNGTLEFWDEFTRDAYPGDGVPGVEDDRLESILEFYDWLCARPEKYADIYFCLDVIDEALNPPDHHEWEKFVGDEEDEYFVDPLRA